MQERFILILLKSDVLLFGDSRLVIDISQPVAVFRTRVRSDGLDLRDPGGSKQNILQCKPTPNLQHWVEEPQKHFAPGASYRQNSPLLTAVKDGYVRLVVPISDISINK
ncbi:hypothetical protein AVEN_98401-1 [Araneus ventricosus]|uniref:Uncharacterized protein n=1 Tax=Araneus ventricosus TaxID=182803 RepID=A0A4Y2I294_ARAVE|nr:hypothetical protein AVEN_98401-1 [Araneus ventricosus]